jgi:hypothetical protein
MVSGAPLSFQPLGHLRQRLPFLYFLQHFFFSLVVANGKGKGRRGAAGLASVLSFLKRICYDLSWLKNPLAQRLRAVRYFNLV